MPHERAAYQGIEGAYSEAAARRFLARTGRQAEPAGHPTFEAAIRAVEAGACGWAMLPIENTTAGSINEVYDLLVRSDLTLVGEEVLAVDHCLLALPGAPEAGIRRILSHPQALAQCMKFLAAREGCETVYFPDTAMAVRKVQSDGDPSQGAIASEEAGRRWGLAVLRRGLADQGRNFTRFVAVARAPWPIPPGTAGRTSIVLAVPHQPGALLRALAVFQTHDINLTKLESRPRPGMPFQYLFYMDFDGRADDPGAAGALEELRGATAFLKTLGTYAAAPRT